MPSFLRRALDALYLGCAVIAALLLAGIGVLISAQIVGRFFGLVVPSANEISGFFLATSTFLALAYSLRAGTHIRVTLLVSRLPGGAQRVATALALLVAAALCAYFTWYSGAQTLESWRYGDLSDGLIGVPLWIPQSSMTVGLAVMTVALLDELAAMRGGGTPRFEGGSEIGIGH